MYQDKSVWWCPSGGLRMGKCESVYIYLIDIYTLAHTRTPIYMSKKYTLYTLGWMAGGVG